MPAQRTIDLLHQRAKELEEALLRGDSPKHISNMCLDLGDDLCASLVAERPETEGDPPAMHCRSCKKRQGMIRRPGSGPHRHALRCAVCNAFICWEGKR